MDKSNKKTLSHFERMSGIFDSIYEGRQASFLYKAVDILFRRNILKRRLRLILELSGDIKGKDVLDIGCGPGRYSVLFAKNRPNFVLGLDISNSMIGLARRLAESNNVADICRFEKCDFLQRDFNDKFDIIVVSGVFDYISDPKPFLLKIKTVLREKAILSFPVKWTLFTPIRMAWLHKRGCPNFYYSKKDIRNLFKNCDLKIDTIKKIGSFLVPGNYIVVYKF